MPTSKLDKERKPNTNVGKQIKEGRHVGLDFYDLLIEALIGPGTTAEAPQRV